MFTSFKFYLKKRFFTFFRILWIRCVNFKLYFSLVTRSEYSGLKLSRFKQYKNTIQIRVRINAVQGVRRWVRTVFGSIPFSWLHALYSWQTCRCYPWTRHGGEVTCRSYHPLGWASTMSFSPFPHFALGQNDCAEIGCAGSSSEKERWERERLLWPPLPFSSKFCSGGISRQCKSS